MSSTRRELNPTIARRQQLVLDKINQLMPPERPSLKVALECVKQFGLKPVNITLLRSTGPQQDRDAAWALYPDSDDIVYTSAIHLKLYYNVFMVMMTMDDIIAVYTEAKSLFREYIRASVLPALKDLQPSALLACMSMWWTRYKLVTDSVRRMLVRADDMVVMPSSAQYANHWVKKTSIVMESMRAFKDLVFDEGSMCSVSESMVGMFTMDRDGIVVDLGMVRDIVHIVLVMGVISEDKVFFQVDVAVNAARGTVGANSSAVVSTYKRIVEDLFLQRTDEYYTRKSSEWLCTMSSSQYLHRVDEVFTSEKQRMASVLLPSTEDLLVKCLQKTLLVSRLQSLMNMPGNTFEDMFAQGHHDDLSLLYRFYSQIGEQEVLPVFLRLKSHCEAAATAIIKTYVDQVTEDKKCAPAAGAQLVDELYKLYTSASHVVDVCFQKNMTAQTRLFSAFNNIMTMPVGTTSVAAILVVFASGVMQGRRGNSKSRLTDAEMDECCGIVMTLFRQLLDRDVFLEGFRQDLSDRLLAGTTVNIDTEKRIVGEMKVHSPSQYVSNMEGMFSDMAFSSEMTRRFEDARGKGGAQARLCILQNSVWPDMLQFEWLKVPPQLEDLMRGAEHSYMTAHQGRVLRWLTGESIIDMVVRFPKGTKTLKMNSVQASLVMLFNQQAVWTVEDVCAALVTGNRPDMVELVKQCIMPMTAPLRLVIKTGDPKHIRPDDSVWLNSEFVNPNRVIRVPCPPLKVLANRSNEKRSADNVGQNREVQMDAAIVRTMKTRTLMSEQELIAETVRQLQHLFSPKPSDVRSRIANLIGREYLEEDGPGKYKYRA